MHSLPPQNKTLVFRLFLSFIIGVFAIAAVVLDPALAGDEERRGFEKRAAQGDPGACEWLLASSQRLGFEAEVRYLLTHFPRQDLAQKIGRPYSASFLERARAYGLHYFPHAEEQEPSIHIDLSGRLAADVFLLMVTLHEEGRLGEFLRDSNLFVLHFDYSSDVTAYSERFSGLCGYQLRLVNGTSPSVEWLKYRSRELGEVALTSYDSSKNLREFLKPSKFLQTRMQVLLDKTPSPEESVSLFVDIISMDYLRAQLSRDASWSLEFFTRGIVETAIEYDLLGIMGDPSDVYMAQYNSWLNEEQRSRLDDHIRDAWPRFLDQKNSPPITPEHRAVIEGYIRGNS